jgi:chromosome segregation ATPase
LDYQESLKRKLSTSRRSETTTQNLLPELNLYKQNNVALQKQIESLMAKLNESKKSERELRSTLGMTEMKCAEFEDKAAHADKLAKSMQALQNTIDHLESRLEIANVERLDAEEQLSNLMNDKSPFDFAPVKPQIPPSANRAASSGRMNISTVFSSLLSTSPELDSQENATLASSVAHTKRLQDQVREKDSRIANLEKERECLRELRQTDTHMERLRVAILNRESVIEEKDKVIHAVQRQLEHHKLLLQAEIRRHAAMKLHVATQEEGSWPELTSLARREDIDRWMDRLHERLRREQSKEKTKALANTPDVQVDSLRQEIDFYVREIILFKLDIKGYKSDIRKLRKITTHMEAFGRTSDLESKVCSLRPTATPVHSHFAPATPELGTANTASPIIDDVHTTTTARTLREPSLAHSPVAPLCNLDCNNTAPRNSRELDIPATLSEMAHKNNYATEADLMNPEVYPHSTVPRSIQSQKSTACALTV